MALPIVFWLGCVIFAMSIMVSLARNGLSSWYYHYSTKPQQNPITTQLHWSLEYLIYWFVGIFVWTEMALRIILVPLDMCIAIVVVLAGRNKSDLDPWIPQHCYITTQNPTLAKSPICAKSTGPSLRVYLPAGGGRFLPCWWRHLKVATATLPMYHFVDASFASY